MNPTCFENTTELTSSAKLNMDKYNLIKHVRFAFGELVNRSAVSSVAFGNPFGVHQTINK